MLYLTNNIFIILNLIIMSNTISICLQIIALILVSLGIIISFISLKIQLKLNLFTDYTKRYQEIMLHIPEEVFSEEGIDYDSEAGRNIILYMRAYFDLCSEEFYLSKGHINMKIWHEWESGIKSYF